MNNVRVICGPTPLSSRVAIGEHEFLADDALGAIGPRPVDLLLAGLGGCTVATIQRRATANGWRVDGVYVELAMHGTAPYQAVGRRVWIDSSLSDEQLHQLARAADVSNLAEILVRPVELSTRVMHFPRPDRPKISPLIG